MNGASAASVIHIALFSTQRLQREAVRRSLSRSNITVDLYASTLDDWRNALSPLSARVCLLDAALPGINEVVKELPMLGFTVVILTQLGALEAIYQAVTSSDATVLTPPSIDDSGELHGAQRFVLQLERLLGARGNGSTQMSESNSTSHAKSDTVSSALGNTFAATRSPSNAAKILAIGASTGGPAAIRTLLNALERPIPYAMLVVQHIDADFAQGFCDWLQSECQLPCQFARASECLQMGHIYVAPPGRHLTVNAYGLLALHTGTVRDAHIPAVDQLFASLALQGKVGLAVLLTGMGEDGACAMRQLRDRGWQTFAQDADSAIVHGMPGTAIAQGAAAHILNPAAIGKYLSSQYRSAKYPAATRMEAR